jgi:GNAT superfamily N-acetyltransferase
MRLSEATLLRIQAMLDEFHLLAADVTERLGACFLRNDATPTRYDGNHVRRIRLDSSARVDDLIAELDHFYAHQAFRAVRVDPWTSPGVEARLLADGYGASGIGVEIVMATEGEVGGTAAAVEILPIEDDWGWAALRELMIADQGNDSGGEETFTLASRRGNAFTWYLAIVEGRAVGHFSERTRDGIGYLEDLMVLPEYRMRGIATALVHRCAESARSKGAELIFLPADANDTPKDMYRRMGFEPIYVFRNYVKLLDAPAAPGPT